MISCLHCVIEMQEDFALVDYQMGGPQHLKWLNIKLYMTIQDCIEYVSYCVNQNMWLFPLAMPGVCAF